MCFVQGMWRFIVCDILRLVIVYRLNNFLEKVRKLERDCTDVASYVSILGEYIRTLRSKSTFNCIVTDPHSI